MIAGSLEPRSGCLSFGCGCNEVTAAQEVATTRAIERSPLCGYGLGGFGISITATPRLETTPRTRSICCDARSVLHSFNELADIDYHIWRDFSGRDGRQDTIGSHDDVRSDQATVGCIDRRFVSPSLRIGHRRFRWKRSRQLFTA